MCVAILSDAILSGTPSWDRTIYGALYLSIISALAARAGDIMQTSGYSGDEFLAFKDIEITLIKDDCGVEKLWAVYTLRATKGYK